MNYIEGVEIQCLDLYSANNGTDLCYYNTNNSYSWSDAYNQCLSSTGDGILIQIFSTDQFNLLKNINIDGARLFWLGANNFASFSDSHWHWLDGSIVDSSVITWCPNSTYGTSIGTQCAAYDSILQCVNNYFCDILLPAPCVSATSGIDQRAKISLISQSKATSLCVSSSTGAYANWWTYSLLILNWFMLFCFLLYLCDRFTINKNTLLLISIFAILSFILIIIYAILWIVQYQDIIKIPLAIVIIGCIAIVLIYADLFLILNDRTRVHRFMACMIFILLTIVVELFLMLGLILCIAYCSQYITLSSSILDKDISASVLASIVAIVSVLCNTGILHLLENDGYNRINVVQPNHTNRISRGLAPTPAQAPISTTNSRHPSQANAQINHHPTYPVAPLKQHDRIERATSPVDERILNEFYADRPKDVHQYSLEGRQYFVYEGTNLTDIESYRRDLTQAMLLQESQGLIDAINRAKNSAYASDLSDEIHQAQALATKLA
ncbi:unnamed protein product [Rotaria magnacalcarata]|uniref:C-type lectin domain-containing protein n=1 Tax=Rotaria magnacalcarata TaxID=392030 RepID=A0A816LJ29_9BILA|nr:unnamed protein product [Rotaria magnacalcarata]CAF2191506.1 unnamed protein product [Rotaria magnacalcarata]CAF3946832.1 unnamed protein product [Rotaria magnacalcarata]CAF4066975.1 unnamed protein product [Rotaria magnacalcarata]